MRKSRLTPRSAVTLAVGLCSLLWVAGVSAVPINLLDNGGFETGNYAGWVVGGNTRNNFVGLDGTVITGTTTLTFGTTLSNVRSGQFSSAHVGRGTPNEVITLTQVIAVQQNDNINVGFWVGNDSNLSGFGLQIQDPRTQIFIDGIGLLGNSNPAVLLGMTPADFIQVMGNFNTGNRKGVST